MPKPEEYFSDLLTRFRPEAALGLSATYQLMLTGDGGGIWHLIVLNQTCQVCPGAAKLPTTTITLPASDWESLVSGQMDAFGAILQGRMRIDGDVMLATRLPGLFGM
jgi:putative sterol carrier protein